ncbi:MAG: purine-nucleoside phosphorylase [Caldilineaceae bacterium]|nr:purine-nucleoside phosphorylase [Caldilineaceae bacterium]MCB9157693.1 purine-nucleoside phosphorylase [Caldilineaceae bacterium]
MSHVSSTEATFTLATYDEAAEFIRQRAGLQPKVGLILGSGLGPLAEQVADAIVLPYGEIPHFPVSTVQGHAGRLVIGRLAGQNVCVMQGRFHFYEGYSMQQLTLPVRVMQRLGIETLILTNAAGGVNQTFQVGDLMIIDDHLNLLGMAGANPLRGPNLDTFGVRFPAMNRAYTRSLRQRADAAAADIGIAVQHGVYAALAGPNFETPAEIRYLRTIGADAVGMSTVPEAIVAHHAGMQVLGISTITNICIDQLDFDAEPTHEEVNAAGKIIVPRLIQLLLALLARL